MKITVLFFLILFIGCTNKEDFSFSEEKEKRIVIPKPILDQLKGGEIILRKGKGYLSTLIVTLLGEELNYSHAGIIIKDTTGVYIIHSLSDDVSDIDGVQICSLNDFLFDIADSSLCIVQPNIDSSGLIEIQEKAKEYLSLKTPFDHHFNMESKDKLHCIELIHDILLEALNKELLPITKRGGIDVVKFSNFFNTTSFNTIYELKTYSNTLK